jgi:Rho-binding antiterminator
MNGYYPIDCDFYDRLEAWVTLRQICKIIYYDSFEELVEVQNQIVDVYTAHKAEHIKLKNGTEIRCDRIISVNDLPILFADSL